MGTVLFLSLLVFFLGASLASFAGLVAYRLRHPAGRSAWAALLGRSRCEGCGEPLTTRELVPVLGWFASLGRCRRCGHHVPAIYPAIEAVTGLAFVAVLFLALRGFG